MYNPVSTYRIQFNKDFTFKKFLEHIDYFSMLGIGTIYASPIFPAERGSMHGYNVVNPNQINPEIGSLEEFEEIISRLKSMNIGWLQDIVPNHMAFHPDNPWLMDVLENGRKSEYASYFDIDFNHPDFSEQIILPVLGKSLEEAVEDGEIKLSNRNDKIMFTYYDYSFPVNRESLAVILQEDINPHLKYIGKKINKSQHIPDPENVVTVINDDITKLKELLSDQHYKLTNWKDVDKHLNYRRFFAISSLISLQMDRDDLFDDYHSFINKLIQTNAIQGLRLDHIDGLKDPSKYIDKLRNLTGDETYIVAEKILTGDEKFPEWWPLQGSSGYDFLAVVNNLLTCRKNFPVFTGFYKTIVGKGIETEEYIYRKKSHILSRSLSGDLENLTRMLIKSNLIKLSNHPGVTYDSMKQAIGEFLLASPRYKLYSNYFPLFDEDIKILNSMISKAGERKPALKKSLKILQDIFLKPGSDKAEALNFFQRCMQFTGPLMAKGIEDTAMFDYNCFVVHNEVGDRIDADGITLSEFHEIMINRQRTLPLSINSSSTHDTKRGEDFRARLNAISELPSQWIENVDLWIKKNKQFKSKIENKRVPDPNEEYFIYQTLIGVLPFKGLADEQLLIRLDEYLKKALREAKINSDWINPDETYETAVCSFARKILDKSSDFLKSFTPFQQKISIYGITNSLIQVTLKSMCPGIPDYYQGTELWDLAMVDPDNRRPVDFDQCTKILIRLIEEEHDNKDNFLQNLYSARENGEIKLWFSHLMIKERSLNPDLFIYGQYYPVEVTGRYREHILAFARSYLNNWYITVIPLYTAILLEQNDAGVIDWEDTSVILPVLAPRSWTTLFGSGFLMAEDSIPVSRILKFPIPEVLKGSDEISRRKAGVLLHITSLPGNYGSGDFGNQAFRFVDFLRKSGQSLWQILPLNPVAGESQYSPYSTYSAFAGNIVMLDPEWLVKYHLISKELLSTSRFINSDKADFNKAEDFKKKIISVAYDNFRLNPMLFLNEKFKKFCLKENYWLDDFVLFLIFKKVFKGKPWSKWPKKIRDRDPSELALYMDNFELEAGKEKFTQFLLFTQWNSLKEYANNNGIRIIGDISFYVGYDSADVWQNPHVFKLDPDKKMLGIGGAPPDYFSETGQLWNMPVYYWDNIRKEDYKWWRNRISKNLEWFNIVRFDHFRGFSGFWEVPAGEITAVNGQWAEAPGVEFFMRLKRDFPDMPFIAEDLGNIDNKVYHLRDSFGLPGMKVLQFAFNDTLEKSIHLPHNFIINSIVYTGTHDNNTTRGWYENEISQEYKKRLEDYTNRKFRGASISEEFLRMAYSSVSYIAIIPLQDILGLDQKFRLNNPSGGKDNWKWKLKSMEPVFAKAWHLAELVKMFYRI